MCEKQLLYGGWRKISEPKISGISWDAREKNVLQPDKIIKFHKFRIKFFFYQTKILILN